MIIGQIPSLADNLLPRHLQEDQRPFLKLIRHYIHWSNRGNVIRSSEIDHVARIILAQNPTSKLDYYLHGETAWDNYRSYVSPGRSIARFQQWYNLEREFEKYETIDEEIFVTADDRNLEAVEDNPFFKLWLNTLGFRGSVEDSALDAVDQGLFIRSLKLLYASKGTPRCIELFFSIFFGEQVTIYIPKFDVATIDDNFILDDIKVVRDDVVFQEYSYVVRVSNVPEFYSSLIEKVYKPHFHPGGFKITLLQNQLTEREALSG